MAFEESAGGIGLRSRGDGGGAAASVAAAGVLRGGNFIAVIVAASIAAVLYIGYTLYVCVYAHIQIHFAVFDQPSYRFQVTYFNSLN